MFTRWRRKRLNKFKAELGGRIDAGITYLGVMRPEWRKAVISHKIDISTGNCILGLVFGSHEEGQEQLELFDAELIEYGFELSSRHLRNDMYVSVANRMWRERIARYDETHRNLKVLDEELDAAEKLLAGHTDDELDILFKQARKAIER